MTNKEAINYILANYFDGDEDVKAVVGGDEEYLAMKYAVEALEKQIPKRPIGDFGSCPHYRCPNCKCSVKMYENDNTYPHCGFCGQALDWSDNDE